MTNKPVNYVFFLVALSFLVNNNCWSQQGYVIFGNPDNMCSGTGICNIKAAPFAQGGTTATPVNFNVRYSSDNSSCTISMIINMSLLYVNQPNQYTNFATGYYEFDYNTTKAVIPANVLNTANPLTLPKSYIIQISPFPQPQPQPLVMTIDLGTFPVPFAAGGNALPKGRQNKGTQKHDYDE